MGKHTPGPWKIKRMKHSEFSFWHYAIEHTTNARDCFVVRECGPVWSRPTKGKPYRNAEALANARLIAAAPELLSALKAIVNEYEQDVWNCIEPTVSIDHYEASKQAIAKAEGRA